MLPDLSLISDFVAKILCLTILLIMLVATMARNKPVSLPAIFTLLLALVVGWLLGDLVVLFDGSDRMNYFNSFSEAHFKRDTNFIARGDKGFYYLVWFLASIFDGRQVLMVIALMYAGIYVIISTRISSRYSLMVFLAFACYFQFTAYGVNTIRAGLAGSIVLLGMTYYRNIPAMATLFLAGFSIHASMLIPIAAFLISRYYTRPQFFFGCWLFSILLSAALGNYFNELFSNMFSFDERVSYLDEDGGPDSAYKTGFRLDFILYSAFPVIMGWFYLLYLKYRSKPYSIFFCTYLIANIFFILVIRSNFSDRFAYLSWFISPIVLIYPLLHKPDLTPYRGYLLSAVLAVEAGFTVLMMFS